MAYSFASDNTAGVHPRIIAALQECDAGFVPPYGNDNITARLDTAYSELFEHEAFVFPAPTGTAANGLAIAAITPPYGAIFCHENAHLVTAEGGAPEFFSGGGRLVLVPGVDNKITPAALQTALDIYGPSQVHRMQAATLSLTQSTERGTVYSLTEIAALCTLAHNSGLKVHMDGARFANALVHLGATPAEMSWKAGIDILAFGTTKNGTMMAEAVIAFDPAIAHVARRLRKRAGFLQSKMRYFSAQLLAYVEDGLWLENARAANATARRIASALHAVPGVGLAHPVEGNQIFVHIPPNINAALQANGIALRPWPSARGDLYRLVASYCDPEDLICRLQTVLSDRENMVPG